MYEKFNNSSALGKEDGGTSVKTPDSRNILPVSRYINPKTDFAFKHIFGKEPHKDLLIDFLNGIFKGRKVIVDLEYTNPIHKGPLPAYRRTVFDLYCTGDKGDRFIVEMQQAKREFFKDRIIFYTTNLIQEQGISVNVDWNYELPEVYFIAIMDFCFEDSDVDHYLHDVRLMEINTNTQFYHKLGYIFIELPKFKKGLAELQTAQDVWLFLLNNLNKLNEIPLSLNENREYVKLFNIAEVSGLNQDEMNAYQESLKVRRDNYSLEETYKNEAIKANQEARIKGKVEGRIEGKIEGLKAAALKLKHMEISSDKIAAATGFTIGEIEEL